MKPYPKYKSSDIQWLGDIPEHWEVKKLKYNTYVKARIGWHGLNSNEFFKDSDGAFCVTGTDFIKGKVNWETCYKIGYERYEEDPYIQLNEDDLLITKDGTIGKTAVVKGLEGKATLNSGVFVVRPNNNDYTTEFMFWVLNSPAFTEFVNFTSKGSTIIHLYQDTFVNYPFVLPSLPEQTAIAQFLDQKTAQINTLIAQKQRLITLLKEERMAFINEILSDESFPLKKLKYVVEVISKGTTPSTEGKTISKEGEIRYLKAENIVKNQVSPSPEFFIDVETNEILKRSKLEENDILIVIAGATIGKVAILPKDFIPANTNQAVCFIRLNKGENHKYFWHYLQSQMVIDIIALDSVQSAQPNLSMEKIANFEIPYPDKETKKKIVESIETTTGKIDATLAKIV